jgi:hypothetical protein
VEMVEKMKKNEKEKEERVGGMVFEDDEKKK